MESKKVEGTEDSSKVYNPFRQRLAGHKPGTEDNLRGKEASGPNGPTHNCPHAVGSLKIIGKVN